MIITILSLLDQALYIELSTHTEYRFLSNLFESNDSKEIRKIQIANKMFKSRLKIFDRISEIDKKCLMIKAFLDKIPENTKFIVVSGKIDDAILLNTLTQEVNKLNGIANKPSALDNYKDQIVSIYYTQIFNGKTKHRHYIGEASKSKRICRFCGNQIPTVSFNHTSHAISELLGNKSLVCREECDICNERFSRIIEPDIANMLSPILTIYSIHGKNGIRTTTGNNFKLSLDESSKEKDEVSAIKLELDQDIPDNIEGFFKKSLLLDTNSLQYIPQNVYKCLCKYVVSVINERYLPNFKKTINWINSTTKYCKLPLVAIGNSRKISDTPNLIVSIRKTNNHNYPYCFALFSIANIVLAFIVPYSSKDKYKFTTSQKYAIFQKMIKSWYVGVKWSFNKLSSSKKTYTKVDFTLQIPPECKLGKDFFIIDMNK